MNNSAQLKKHEYRFDVAISFAGDNKRRKVRKVAKILRKRLGKKRVFFDEFFQAEIAGTNADTYLQNVYQNDSCLVVSCVCKRYDEKPWTKAEWRAIRARIADCEQTAESRLNFLPLRFGDGEVDGLFSSLDVAPEVQESNPKEIAKLILDRLELVQAQGCNLTGSNKENDGKENRTNSSSSYKQLVEEYTRAKTRLQISCSLTLAIFLLTGLSILWIAGGESRAIIRLEQKGWVISEFSIEGGYKVAPLRDEQGQVIGSISFEDSIDDIVSLDPRSLDFSACQLNECSLAPLAPLSNLERLNVNGTGCRCEELSNFAEHLEALRVLEVGNCCLDNLDFLDSLTSLEILRIKNSKNNQCSFFSLDKVANHRSLKHLELQHCEVSQVVFENHPTLEKVFLTDCPVNELRVKDSKKLTDMKISKAKLAKDSNKNYRLENLSSLRSLEFIMISSLESIIISDVPNLKSLSISNNDQLSNVLLNDVDSLDNGKIKFAENPRLENVYFVKIEDLFVKKNSFEFKTNGKNLENKTTFWVENDEAKNWILQQEPANQETPIFVEDTDYDVQTFTPDEKKKASELMSPSVNE